MDQVQQKCFQCAKEKEQMRTVTCSTVQMARITLLQTSVVHTGTYLLNIDEIIKPVHDHANAIVSFQDK